jgi:transglutaminase-like putative cysteine protease
MGSKKTAGISMVFILLFVPEFYAADVVYDKSKINDGVIGVEYNGGLEKPIKATVEKGGDRYTYSLKKNELYYLPLQMGTGEYKISVLENIQGTKYKSLDATMVELKLEPTIKMFTYSTPITYFDTTMASIKSYGEQIKLKSASDKVNILYSDVIKNYKYDYDKVNNLPSDYVPNIDDMYNLKKGICYDYASLMSGVLRSQGIPVKLVMGYAPEVKQYHSWNEIYLNNKWNVVDTTYDATMFQAGKATSFSKDASKFKIVKVY